MTQPTRFNKDHTPDHSTKEEWVNFLHLHLGKYGDPPEHIRQAINYALGEQHSPGGFVLDLVDNGVRKGVVVVNRTGMTGYIPENILVYIATHQDHRGEGLGTTLMNSAVDEADGDIALHVEADNPAKRLYERIGFTNPYLEMRLKK